MQSNCSEAAFIVFSCLFQFVCIAQQDYCCILNQVEKNMQKVEEEGEIVMVKEHRELDRTGTRKGHIVIKVEKKEKVQTKGVLTCCVCYVYQIVQVKLNTCVEQGTAERLTMHLVEEHSVVDPTYIEDFLLTYRTFLSSPMVVGKKLLEWFHDPSLRDKVCRSSNTVTTGSSKCCIHLIARRSSVRYSTSGPLHVVPMPAWLLCRDFILLPQSKLKQSSLLGGSKLPLDLSR